MITALNEQVKTLQGQAEEHFGRHQDAEIYRSQPGMGAILGARVLAEFGGDPHRYTDGKARRNYAATSSVTRASAWVNAVLMHGINDHGPAVLLRFCLEHGYQLSRLFGRSAAQLAEQGGEPAADGQLPSLGVEVVAVQGGGLATAQAAHRRGAEQPAVSGASVQVAQVFGTYRVSAFRQKRG